MTHDSHQNQNAAHDMLHAARAFYNHGWLLGTSGNLSVRTNNTEHFLITASGKDKGQLEPTDFLICDLNSSPVGQTPHRPSAETLVHAVIYKHLPEAGAIYHVHQLHAALCSDRDKNSDRNKSTTHLKDLEMIKGLGIWQPDAEIHVPIIENHYDIPTLAKAIEDHITSDEFDPRIPGVNIHNHGIYAWGKNAAEAKRHIESFGYLFHYSWERTRR